MLGIAASATNRVLRAIGKWLPGQVPDPFLPLWDAPPLGCGHYGCVYTTRSDNVVLKVTTDPTEVHFVQAALQLGDWPDGIVRYHQLMMVPDATYRGRPYYLIWREAAFDVGKVIGGQQSDDYWRRAFIVAGHRLTDFKTFASCAREAIDRAKDRTQALCQAKRVEDWAWERAMDVDWEERVRAQWRLSPKEVFRPYEHWKGYQRIAYCLAACKATVEMMENEPGLDAVGRALGFYLEHGLLLADVHHGNIGRVRRDGYDVVAITDPGHLSDLRAMTSC